jgi:hypothetical protein
MFRGTPIYYNDNNVIPAKAGIQFVSSGLKGRKITIGGRCPPYKSM